ncbi:MAG: hypothetical protein IKN15_06105 [Bacteroidaceae bacterium]|jgi:hypothetical protein|nr:hypothetical protein [Bacteroidaceae bacterium]
MKSMIIMAIALICSCSVFAQQKNLSKMNEKARNEYLVKLAREVTNNFGPGWIQGKVVPVISPLKTYEEDEEAEDFEKPLIGRKYYEVKFSYDRATHEELGWSFASFVNIWEDTGEPMDVIFGNYYGLDFINIPYRSWVKAGVEDSEKMYFVDMWELLPEQMREDAKKEIKQRK